MLKLEDINIVELQICSEHSLLTLHSQMRTSNRNLAILGGRESDVKHTETNTKKDFEKDKFSEHIITYFLESNETNSF